MINLDYGYHIDSDPYNYILYRDGVKDKKGNLLKADVTYHSTIGQALYTYMQIVQRNAIHNNDITLTEAIDFFKALKSTMDEIKAKLDISEMEILNDARNSRNHK